MTDITNKKKDSILKTLAIAGFIGIIVLIAWASTQLVNIIPNAFSSLASLVESMDRYEKTLVEESDTETLTLTSKTLVNVGETANLSWNKTEVAGSYTFSYECTEGVAINIVDNSNIGSIDCDTNYNIGEVDSLAILISSEKERYSDINYTISFLAVNDTKPRADGTATITVINSTVDSDLTENENTNTTTTKDTEEVTVSDTEDSESEILTSSEEVVVYEQEFIYSIPVSDPNGKTDLSAKFLITGVIEDDKFIPGIIRQTDEGAIQFEVKNYGTKTSENWTYKVSLPDGGMYESPELEPLKPNERALLTIGFATTDRATHTFEVSVDEDTDVNNANDKFSRFIVFLK